MTGSAYQEVHVLEYIIGSAYQAVHVKQYKNKQYMLGSTVGA
jgi:hypothetical protein